jgi:hypothetical protein
VHDVTHGLSPLGSGGTFKLPPVLGLTSKFIALVLGFNEPPLAKELVIES